MKSLRLFLCASFSAVLLHAAEPTDYQVTGPIVELTDSTIVVMKGKDKWELARGADTKVTGDLKVGAKVTIHYTMTAKTIEAKADKGAAEAKPAATDAKPAGKAPSKKGK